jgi:hypothetical protein
VIGEDIGNLDNSLPDVQLFSVQMVDDHFVEIIHFFSTGVTPFDMKISQNKKLVFKASDYQLIVEKLYKLCIDGVLQQCMLEQEKPIILVEEHEGIARGNYVRKPTMHNILCTGIWWPTLHKDAKEYCHIWKKI